MPMGKGVHMQQLLKKFPWNAFSAIMLPIIFCSSYAISGEPKTANETFERLTITPHRILQLETGKSITLTIGRFADATKGGFYEEVKLPVVWSIEPATDITLDPKTGVISVEDTIAGIKTFEINANIADGKKVLSKMLYVYNPLSVPFIRLWKEQSRIPCNTGETVDDFSPIQELEFLADGTFSVTWRPFESYMDYWGEYSVDYKNKKLELKVINGNYIPSDIVPKGSFKFEEEGGVSLREIYFGTGRTDTTTNRSCGYLFK